MRIYVILEGNGTIAPWYNATQVFQRSKYGGQDTITYSFRLFTTDHVLQLAALSIVRPIFSK